MRKTLSILLCLCTSIVLAQAPVPTSWDFESFQPIPTGWTITDISTVGGLTYQAANSCGSIALRLDADNEALTIWMGQQPGPVTLSARATGPWGAGIFRVQESVDGLSYSNMFSWTQTTPLSQSACTTITVTPANTLSRYIRLFYEDKISGANIAIDDVSIAAPVITAATLQVEQSTNTVFNGSYAAPFGAAVATPTTAAFNLNNIGTVDSLTIDSVVISGLNASEFVTTAPATFPATVSALGSQLWNIQFTPTAPGTRLATASIYSNDALTPVYVVNLYGVGGTLATEPADQATSMTFPVNKTYRIRMSFNEAATPADALGGYLVLRSNNGAVGDLPVDGIEYKRGMNIGSAKVVYSGPVNNTITLTPTRIAANSTYHFAVFKYNGSGVFRNYNNTAPLTGNVTTPASMAAPNEYSSINTANSSFPADLNALINPHNAVFYSTFATTNVSLFEMRDTFAVVGANTFTRAVTCSYSGENKLYNEPFDWTGTGYSREHTFPHSWMPTNPADNPEKPEYNDQHHLFVTRQTNVNELRCNYPLGEVVSGAVTFLEGKLGLDSLGKKVYEPRDAHKGRAARAMMYVSACYHNVNGNNWSFPDSIGVCLGTPVPYGQDQWVLKRWHFQHPPDNYDFSRNDFLDSLQQNRNPFVDHPEYACYIDFSNMSYVSNPVVPCLGLGVSDRNKAFSNLYIAPNPVSSELNLFLSARTDEELVIELLDISGKKVQTYAWPVNAGSNTKTIVPQVESGVYLLRILSGGELISVQRFARQ